MQIKLFVLKFLIFTFNLQINLIAAQFNPGDRLVIKESVVDFSTSCLGSRLATLNAPASPEVRKCHRAHQGLFNEIVNYDTCLDTTIQISYKNIIYGFDEQTKQPLQSFWTSANQVALIADLAPELVAAIPTENTPNITLIYPTHNLSVGTKLVRVPELDQVDSYAVKINNYAQNICETVQIKKINSLIDQPRTKVEARVLFVNILSKLIDRVSHQQSDATGVSNLIIPYVWGGSSFITANQITDFSQINGAWERPKIKAIYTGYDCSELVMRFAKIAGLDFPWKNSKTISDCCPVLTEQDQIEIGDLIWVPGHIMIISDIINPEIIHARSYSGGYGCVHKGPFAETIVNANSITELRELYVNKQPLILTDKLGNKREYTEFKILKLN